MSRARLATLAAATIALSAAAVAVPASAAVAAPAPPAGEAPSDIRIGRDAPNVLDGERFKVPDHYTAPGDETSNRLFQSTDTPPVGTVRQWIGADDYAGYYRKDFTLRGVGQFVEVWVANDLAFGEDDCRNAVPDSTTVTDAQVAALVEQFDTVIYPRETTTFSTPPDRDGSNALLGPDASGSGGVYTGNGARTVTLVDNIRDDNYYDFPAASTYTAGFFSAALTELFDRNTMTIDAFDWAHRTTANPPDAATANLCTSRPGRPWLYEGVFAHEWQHLLHYYADPFETTWLNEGLSDLAMALGGYSNSTATVFDPNPDRHIACFQGYGPVETPYNPNPLNCGGAQDSLTLWGESASPSALLASYGNAYSFFLYLYDHYGADFVSSLHRDHERQGLSSLDAQLDAVGTHNLYSVIHDYQTMTLVDQLIGDSNRSIMLGVPKRRVTAQSLRASVNLDNPESYQVPGAAPNGADYVLLRSNGKPISGRNLRTLRFSGVETLPAVPLSWTVVADDPDRSGDPVLFSGNSSNTDAAMVTAIQVPASDPTLRFLAKYGAEEGYDYGYVAVSTDQGATYTVIPGDRTVQGPLGPGLNGSTTGFEQHSFDLSAYAGQQILLSLRYVSDGGVNEGGLLVDDLTVGGVTVSDGSSLDPFDSPSEIKPTEVHNWNLRLVGIDRQRARALQVEFNGRRPVQLNRFSPQLKALSRFPTVVAIVAYDEPTEQVGQYAPYTLTVNGVVQPGGGPAK
ncbi:MAG: immune inhibitor A [Micromonosporaceae bacterium]|nr:immune inhibitor A [Micromonosporaceae bacterium]